MIELLVNEQLVELSEDFQILINKSIADIRNPENRSSDWSKTITIPGTSVNNKLFGHLFEVGDSITGTSFNPNKKANCTVLLDGMEQMRGFIRLTQINVLDNDDIEYQATIHGESANLFTDIENAKLSDLDFSEYNHVLNIQNVKDSWDSQIYVNGSTQAFEYGVGYVWSQILPKRVSKNTNVDQWKTDDHTPCLYAKTVVDKIFSVNGYQYSTDSFFTTDRFKRLIIPYSNDALTTGVTAVNNRLFYAGVSSSGVTSTGSTIQIDDDSSGSFYDNGGNFDTGAYAYTAPAKANYTFNFKLEAVYNEPTPRATSNIMGAYIDIYVNGTQDTTMYLFSNSSTDTWIWDTNSAVTINLDLNDVVTFRYNGMKFGRQGVLENNSITIATGTEVFNTSYAQTLGNNRTADFGVFFNDEHTQKDFLLSLVRMFNLYIEQLDDGTLRFVPRDEFYDGSNVDWSKKLDYSQAHEILPMGDLQNNPYKFSYSEGDDLENENYKTLSGRIYGDRTIRVDNDFIKDEKKIELVFQPTHFIEPKAKRYYSIMSTDKGETAAGLRILYYSGTQTLGSLYILYDTTAISPNINYYPVSTHVDDPYNMSFDLLFGMPKRINTYGFTYSNQNLINVYYYRTLAEIIDKDSKLFRGYFRITPADFQKLRFNSLYFFEGQYWKLNKIFDYNPQSDGLTKCEFLLSVFYEPSKTGNRFVGEGGFDTDNVFNPDVYVPQGRPKFLPSYNGSDGVNAGDNIGDGGDSVLTGDGIENYGHFNMVVGSENVSVGTFDNVTALNCTDFEIPEGQRVYVENYPVVGAWLGSGKVVNIDDTDSPYSATYDDYLILCDTTSGSITVTLPTPSDANKGKMYVIKKTQSANQVTINAGDGSVLIDDATSHSDNAKNGYDQVMSDGSQYWIITHGH